MTEIEFINAIDCRFPYHDRVNARALIETSLHVSANAVFTVVHELARPGRSVKVSAIVLLDLLSELEARFEHPLKTLVFSAAIRMIRGEQLSEREILLAISQIAEFPGEYQALNVIYFSGEPSDLVEEAFDDVRSRWQKASSK